MDIGFIGLGNMGLPMARSLLKAGHKVRVYNRTLSRAEPLEKEGAVVAKTPAEASDGDAVITMLANDQAVEAIVFGENGLLQGLKPGAAHISASTITVALSDRLQHAHAAARQIYIAAPVFGRPEAAAAAKLFVVAAGEKAAVDRLQPLFDAIGQRSFFVSEHAPDANLVKLGGNFLIASVIESLAETVALVRKYGIEPDRFVGIMTETLFNAPVYKTYGALIAEEKYEPAGFKMGLGLKDVRSVLAAAEAKSVAMPVGSAIRDRFLSAIARGNGELDWSALAKTTAEDAGLKS